MQSPPPHAPALGPDARFSPGQPLYSAHLHSPSPGSARPPSQPMSTVHPSQPMSSAHRPPPLSGGHLLSPHGPSPAAHPSPGPGGGSTASPAYASHGPRMKKRLIVACDGTWLNSNDMLRREKLELPSNVTKICRAIKAESSDRIAQIVYYLPGVGTSGGTLSRIFGGATAQGLGETIREGYASLANNYIPGDEIFLLGFSRGAFTARSIAGLIDAVGLLTKSGLPSLGIVFADVQHRHNPRYESPYPNLPFQNKPSVRDPRYKAELYRLGLSNTDVPIRAIGVWDTVGSLGIPRIPLLESLGLQSRDIRTYKFYDTTLGDSIENAFQALALDERRSSYYPAVWEKRSKNQTNLRQVWFPGVHSNVGGGYPDQELSNITLAWMIAQLEPFIDFDHDFVRQQFLLNTEYYEQSNQDPRPWSFGELYNSVTGLFVLGGKVTRTPGAYNRVDPRTGQPTRKPLRNTFEYVHPSARARLVLDGPGVSDFRAYDCPALTTEYKLRATRAGPDENQPLAVWESRSQRKGIPRRTLNESPLWETELRLLRYSPRVHSFLLDEPARPSR